MHLVTPEQLRDRVRHALDIKTGGGAVWQGEKFLDECLDQYLGELYDLLIDAYGMDYAFSITAFPTIAGSGTYDLPVNFYKAHRVLVQIGNVIVPIEPYTFSDFTTTPDRQPWRVGTRIRYRISGLGHENAKHPRSVSPTVINFDPIPDAAYTVRVWFSPAFPGLSKTQQFDDVNGWSWFAVYGACADIRSRMDDDPSYFLARQEQYRARLAGVAGRRDVGGVERVVDLKRDRRRRRSWGFT